MNNISWQEREADEVAALCKEYTLTSWRPQATWVPRAVVTGGQGCYYWDNEGKRYLDFSSQFMCVNVGHQHPKVIQAIIDQVQKLCYVDARYATHARAELGRLLVEVTPANIKKIFICLSGSDAMENAMKIAKMYSGKHKFISTFRSYHGCTHGAGSITGESRRWVVEPSLTDTIHVPAPYCYRCDFGLDPETCDVRCAQYIRNVIEYESAERVAAVVLEGVIGANAILYPHRDDYMTTVRQICDETGVLLIVDEVMSGLGRTGEWFAVDHWGVQPDIITMAKGLSGSHFPLGAVAVSEPIAKHFDDNRLMVGTTCANHALGCAAAIATINIYKEEGLIENSKQLGIYLTQRLNQMAERHPSIGDVRGLGLFQFMELVKNKRTKESFSTSTRTIAPRAPVLDIVDNELLKRGVSAMVHTTGIFVTPPLCITRQELDHGLDMIDEVLSFTTDPLVEA